MISSSSHWRFSVATVACAVLGAVAVALMVSPNASAITCRAPGARLTEVNLAVNMSCRAAREDLDGFVDAFAPTFRTPGGYSCARIAHMPRENSWRCVKRLSSYRFSREGVTRAGVRVQGTGYDKTFTVTRCTNTGETDLVLNGSGAGGIKLKLSAPTGSGTIGIAGGNEEDSISARGTVSSVRVGDDGSLVAAATFTSGLSGRFKVSGECR